MNNISQISVFDYSEIESLEDLERLKLFFENLDDKKLCKTLKMKEKMKLMLNLSFLVMLTMAKGHIINKQENIRSLVS